jgi:hypothetical protein
VLGVLAAVPAAARQPSAAPPRGALAARLQAGVPGAPAVVAGLCCIALALLAVAVAGAGGPGPASAAGALKADNGHPLYTYVGDTAPGQARGNGLNLNGGLWHEVTVSG